MSPEYFHRHLTFYEASDFLDGLAMRYHTQWECARWQTTFIAKCAGNKNYNAPEFPWEKEARRKRASADMPTEAEQASLRKQGEAWAAMLNKRFKKQ